MPEEIMLVCIIGVIFTASVIKRVIAHRENMAQIRLQSPPMNSLPPAGLEELRKDIASLRDTSTQFDMSFDAALQRLEARVRHLENSRMGVQQSPAVPTEQSRS